MDLSMWFMPLGGSLRERLRFAPIALTKKQEKDMQNRFPKQNLEQTQTPTNGDFTDKTITCRDCKQPFIFTARDQAFYADKRYTEPRGCKPCRDARKRDQGQTPNNGFSPSIQTASSYPAATQPVVEEEQGRGRRKNRRNRDEDFDNDDWGSYRRRR